MKQQFLLLLLLLAATPSAVARAQGYAPNSAAQRMTPADDLQVALVAAEPDVRQPVAIEFDDRGRLWVIQYLQYPNPEGLKRVAVDRYSRTRYDRRPEPPPRGPKGADRITILEADPRKPGKIRAKDFVNGLNLASGLAFGHGGVFVLQTPYLLFYPDRNRDDAPDGDPEVLLTGFGMEDAHSVANSLTWGPDGWLYGCQGSTVTANIRGIEFQQGVWRYHPLSHRFELFCEGGGNSWGLDFDAHGNLFYSTNHGGFCMLHGVQGGYYWKQFGKHGALHNPYTYGYFDHVPHRNLRGGHVTVGGIIYQGASLPDRYRGKYIAADLLGHAVYWHELESDGASFRGRFGAEIMAANDTWFAPSDVTAGPDGAIYIADWHDRRTAHPDPDAEWDRSNGRIFRIAARQAAPAVFQDLTHVNSTELLKQLSHRDDWYVRRARRILADRRDPEVILPLRRLIVETSNDELALQALWALYVSGGFNEPLAQGLLNHRSAHVRCWTVRLLGDESSLSPQITNRLTDLAAQETNPSVRSQLACSSRRWPATAGLPILLRLARNSEDARDPHMPLLLWWGAEHFAISNLDEVLATFNTADAWEQPFIRSTVLLRLMRRYAAEGSQRSYTACEQLLAFAPRTQQLQLAAAFELGLQEQSRGHQRNLGALFEREAQIEPPNRDRGRPVVSLSGALQRRLNALWQASPDDPRMIRLMLRLGSTDAQNRAQSFAAARHASLELRLEMVGALGTLGAPNAAATLLQLLEDQRTTPERLGLAVLTALAGIDDETVATGVLRQYPDMPAAMRKRAIDILVSRKAWAGRFLQAVDEGRIRATDADVEQLRVVALHANATLDALVRKHWGNIQRGTPEQKLAEMRRFNNDLRAGAGDPGAGRVLYQKHCANCHRLFSDGNNVGPDLTHANRKDRDFLLVNLVDPNALIRKEYLSYTIQTIDGRLLTGLLAEQTASSVTLLTSKNERIGVARAQIADIHEASVSLMPENLLKDLKPQELRDLFAFLQRDKPL